MNDKKIMILGASILQLPAILKAKEMGLVVIAVDMDKDAIGFEYADFCLEISTIDISKVLKAAKEYKIDGIMTLASDMPMRTVAAVVEELGLFGINKKTALRATNKARMRECLRSNNIQSPKFFKAKNKSEYLNGVKQLLGRFIVKPVDNSGSRGVFFVNSNDKNEINFAYELSRKNSRSGEVIVEEFMEGPEVSVESLSIDNEVHILAVTDKITTGPPKFVEMGHSQPSGFSEDIIKKIEDITISSIKAIGIKNGPSHTEIIVTKEGPKVVEIGARLGGDNITTHLVPLSTGIDMVESCIKIALGMKPTLDKKLNCGAAIRYFASQKGKIEKIVGVEKAKQLPGIKEIYFVKNTGDMIEEIKDSSNRIGYIIARGRNVPEAINLCEKAKEMIKIDII